MRIPARPPSALDAAERAVYDEIAGGPRAAGPQHFPLTRDDGSLRGPFNALLLSPALGSAVQRLGAAVRYSTDLTAREREISILLVAASWNSAFERESHEAVGRAAGLTDREILDLRTGRVPALDDERERLCAETVAALTQGDLSDAQWERARDALGAEIVFELSTLVGYYALLALQLRVFRVDSDRGGSP
ncbi:carboxymuconolactone decarboxylase family protein [Pseudolysinimonas sp.]